MSRDSSLFVTCGSKTIDNMVIQRVLESFVKYGWSISQNELLCILPVGDAGRYEWTDIPAKGFDLEKYLAEKYRLKEPVGFQLINNDTSFGCVILFFFNHDDKWNTFTITFDLGFERKDTDNGNTDVSWYLDRISQVLEEVELPIFSFEFKEFL